MNAFMSLKRTITLAIILLSFGYIGSGCATFDNNQQTSNETENVNADRLDIRGKITQMRMVQDDRKESENNPNPDTPYPTTKIRTTVQNLGM